MDRRTVTLLLSSTVDEHLHAVFARRESGVLLHISSLPGAYGIGDLGPAAHRFAEFLASAGQRLWQVLPLGPPVVRSPYESQSSAAGNPLFIDPTQLVELGLLAPADLEHEAFPLDRVDFGRVIPWRTALLGRAAQSFLRRPAADLGTEFDGFCRAQAAWLDPFARYSALKARFNGAPWTAWPAGATVDDEASIEHHKFIQFLFARQWASLREHCARLGIRIIGDLPLYPASDSVDTFANREYFELDAGGHPTVVAGVPPDYFSETGQRWGNPVYRWDRIADDGFGWWTQRLSAVLQWVDIVRIDHFRGLEAYWAIPAADTDARGGQWRKAPGRELLRTASAVLGGLPAIAEDLGDISRAVHDLRDEFSLPGMRVLQFAFSGEPSAAPFLPHNYVPNCVAYTGTHDNNTTAGWFRDRERPGAALQGARALRYLGAEPDGIHAGFVRGVLASVARAAVFPLQDLLGLGAPARMNRPGTLDDRNWSWRVRQDQLSGVDAPLRELTELCERC